MRNRVLCCVLLILFHGPAVAASAGASPQSAPVQAAHEKRGGAEIFSLANGLVRCSVTVENGAIIGDRLEALSSLSPTMKTPFMTVESDAGFALDIMWTDWQAPEKAGNAENPVVLGKSDFVFRDSRLLELPSGGKSVELVCVGRNQPLEVRLTYELEPGAFFARRRLAVRLGAAPASDNASSPGPHFLRWVWPRRGALKLPPGFSLLKAGGFGQPAAFLADSGGAFFGLEYPTAENSLVVRADGTPVLACGQEVGERIGGQWVESEAVVEAVTPDPFVKLWFWKYLDRVRAALERPYVLYNSWYDLRSPDYKLGPDRLLDEKNLVNSAGVLRRKLVEEQGVKLDAFVLDDGWDVYAGAWEMSHAQFPQGLAPIAEALKPMASRLGIWFGPIGGYNRRAERVNWMREHGYETVDGEMCVAGEKYKALLKKRVTDFIRNDAVGYFKWDGIQFSCSEPGHGHLPDVYSRRAVMQAVAELCRTARSERRDMFLNITSGTWLSPWWVRYADAIWMQGQDYGFADVPSISRRDQSTTYRDSVLYDDLKKQDFWFPVSSLMTHGVIRARVSPFADPVEALDKFTDEVALYAARGISMWELYISPDLLTDGEWKAEADSIRWLKENFEVLRTVEMIGGDPRRHEPYGYAHFKGRRGIVAARNPVIEPQALRLEFSAGLGLDPDARDLVLERVYPSRWVSPALFKAGDSADVRLQGFETAIYEVYPLAEAREPLVAGAVFGSEVREAGGFAVDIYEAGEKARLLNPVAVREASVDGKRMEPGSLAIPVMNAESPVSEVTLGAEPNSRGEQRLKFKIGKAATTATLAVLITPDPEFRGRDIPNLELVGESIPRVLTVEQEKGSWAWHKFEVGPGGHDLSVRLVRASARVPWQGRAAFWLITTEKRAAARLDFRMRQALRTRRILPPLPYPPGVFSRTTQLGAAAVKLES